MRALILSALLLSSSGLAKAQFHTEVNKAFDRSKAAITETILMGRENESLCETDDKTVRYAGPTDLGFYTCIYKAAQGGANHLTITSFGGAVVNAIPAANIIATHEMSVSILGVCASSCGNYIAPAAAGLSVLPYSVWSVHGAPGPVGKSALRDAMAASGANEEQIEQSLSSNLRRGHFEYTLHNAFKARHKIQNGLYDAAQLSAAQRALGDSSLLYLSRASAAACVPTLQIEAFWTAGNRDDKQKLRRLFPTSPIGEYGALTENHVCRETYADD